MGDNMLNTVLHGDCLELMKDISDKSIDMILCDLPVANHIISDIILL